MRSRYILYYDRITLHHLMYIVYNMFILHRSTICDTQVVKLKKSTHAQMKTTDFNSL